MYLVKCNNKHMLAFQHMSTCLYMSGPLPNTLEDFWRMIWEHKLNTVVMLTKCFEETVSIIIVVINNVHRL